MLTVINETQQVFNGVKFYLQKSGYFRRWGAQPCTLLHRSVWTFHNGPIPEGFVIHHIDGNKANNELENLELLPIGEHHSIHSRGKEHLDKFAPNRVMGTRASWQKAIEEVHVCPECGKEFRSHAFNKKFCSIPCRKKAYARVYKRPPRSGKKVA